MDISKLKELIGDFAKDIRLNISVVLTPEGAPGLSELQIRGVALACAYSVKCAELVDSLKEALGTAGEAYVQGAKSASAIMAMNNVYYRSMHLVDDLEMKAMPARLRMMVIGNPGIPKVDFELMCLGVSAIAGCASCMNAHILEIKKADLPSQSAHSTIRIAAVVNAFAQSLWLSV